MDLIMVVLFVLAAVMLIDGLVLVYFTILRPPSDPHA